MSIMTARNLEAAIALQNSVDYGLTAGIHSLNSQEINDWLSRVQAGNVYVNRGITGAIVQRQPFGGWKRSAVGPGAKAGGPNYLFGLTDWQSESNNAVESIDSAVINELLVMAAQSVLSDSEMESLIRSAQSDLAALKHYFSGSKDATGLSAELNYLRYFRSDCMLRLNEKATEYEIWRALVTAAAVGSVEVSAAGLPVRLSRMLTRTGLKLRVESEEQWLAGLKGPRRVRVLGLKQWHERLSDPDIAIYEGDVTESGIIELLPYFKEQAVSVTAHRFGNPARHVKSLQL